VTNVDEFLRRIFAVIHSNDPVARALTLRTLGFIAAIVPEKKQATTIFKTLRFFS
jgi:integrator complex subunit 7